MAVSEFQLIERYFTDAGVPRDDVVWGVGDDAAILSLPAGHELVVSTDTLVAGVHFFADVDPVSLGHKALAVNLSDLAAMGAQPAWVMLALTLPQVDEQWLCGFSQGFSSLACQHGVQLIGGDTTRGPLSITVQAMGFVKQGAAWRRDAATPGDLIYVTGTLGDAGLALQIRERRLPFVQHHCDELLRRLERPTPRNVEALALNGLVNAAIDLSDGLLSDLGPLSSAFNACQRDECNEQLSSELWQALPLSAGDDYELCFTIAAEKQDEVEQQLSQHGLIAHRIGVIDNGPGLRCVLSNGELYQAQQSGYEHFQGAPGVDEQVNER